MKFRVFRVHSEAGGGYFLLDISDAHVAVLEAHAAAQNVPLHVAIQMILETEITRVHQDLEDAKAAFTLMRDSELLQLRNAFVGDRDQAKRERRDDTDALRARPPRADRSDPRRARREGADVSRDRRLPT